MAVPFGSPQVHLAHTPTEGGKKERRKEGKPVLGSSLTLNPSHGLLDRKAASHTRPLKDLAGSTDQPPPLSLGAALPLGRELALTSGCCALGLSLGRIAGHLAPLSAQGGKERTTRHTPGLGSHGPNETASRWATAAEAAVSDLLPTLADGRVPWQLSGSASGQNVLPCFP